MNRVLCWLTGGHRYAAINLMSGSGLFTNGTVFSNHCLKCGKRYATVVDMEPIIQAEIEKKMREMGYNNNAE